MLRAVAFLSLLHLIKAHSVINVYGDVHKDTKFFTTTFPWIVDNIGGDITAEFHLLGSGRYSVPQMCALRALTGNTFLQAQYLKCEAEGNPSKYCLCETSINPEEFTECVHHRGYLASNAAAEFSKLNIGTTPLIELGSGYPAVTIFEVTDTWYLKKICTMFGDYPPMGCVKPSAYNSTEEWVHKKAIAQFDRECKIYPIVVPITTTTYTEKDYYEEFNYE